MPGRQHRAHPRGAEAGQAAVESALTLPFAVFLVLGTLQLFMMLQGRILAEYAVFRTTRAGSVNQADCRVMTHTAVASLLPAITATDSATALGTAFRLRSGNRYLPLQDGGRSGPIVWLSRRTDRTGQDLQETFDDRYRRESRMELQVDLVFWFPLRIPFADWVMSRMFLAHYGILNYTRFDPLMPTKTDTDWAAGGPGSAPFDATVASELRRRILLRQYVAPIVSSFRMRMMTPALQLGQACPNSPANP